MNDYKENNFCFVFDAVFIIFNSILLYLTKLSLVKA